MTARPVEVLVVAYGQPALLDSTLAALEGCYAVHVVDNSSSHEVAAVAACHGARYTDPGRNGGFAAGVNAGLAHRLAGDPADVLLLNPDAVIAPDGVSALQAALLAPGRERVAAVSPSLREPDGSAQRVMWPFPHPARAWLETLGLGRLNRAADFAVGTVLLLRWEALQDVGTFDERYFLYAEETDWQRQARAKGWTAHHEAAVVARHIGGATSTDPERRERLFHAGTETYVRKWFGTTGWQTYRAASWCGAVARGVALPGRRGAAARARARILRQGPRRVAGLGVR
ncbi:glycosyltransferase family 2 protein [Kineosporia sp. R_H_3]|uniref:glycosyltransferase family 2 protein n=1 Tax=Kineosporia sp. R_H_3 TaxID=1961848 RepID=UPI001304790B|nr:glycosyltransferase family 2 protein [Kineosporia sp. R_H_3]